MKQNNLNLNQENPQILDLKIIISNLESEIKVCKKELTISNFKLNRTLKDTKALNNILKDALEQLKYQKQMLANQALELQAANTENNNILEELNAKNDMLNSSFAHLNIRQKESERKDKNIQASIAYARLIQTAILPTRTSIEPYIDDFFVFYKPKDVVSGDFYWFYPIQNTDLGSDQKITERYILAVADCTGHGVPGAFMSLIGDSLLRTIIMGKKIYNPARILDQMHKGITQALHQKDTRIGDGMDIAIVLVDKKAKTLSFAGAHNSLYFINQELDYSGKLQEIKADKMPVGGTQLENRPSFAEHSLDISTPTNIYLFTDGYQDQFGGTDNKKFMKNKFRQILTNIASSPFLDQYNELSSTFDNWKGKNFQTDDVLVLGLKVS